MAKDKVREVRNEQVVMSKADIIRASKMPEHQKIAYLKDIGEIKDADFDPTKVSFHVYARARSVHVTKQKAMLVYPKASGVSLASLEEWDEIFKDF